MERCTNPPRITNPKSSCPDKGRPFFITQFPYWLLLGVKSQGCTGLPSERPPRVPGRKLVGHTRVRLMGPQWASLHGHHMSTLNAQGASIHTRRLAPSWAAARSLPKPKNGPTQGGPQWSVSRAHTCLQPDPGHRWPVPSCVGASQATADHAASRAQHSAAEHGQTPAQERLMTHTNKYFIFMV